MGGGGGLQDGGGGSRMLAVTVTEVEAGATSPLLRTAGLISSRLGISFIAITGFGAIFGFSGLISFSTFFVGLTSSSSSLTSHSTSLVSLSDLSSQGITL